MLLLSEADYSFTRAFARATNDDHPEGGVELTATEYGNPTDLADRYYAGDTTKTNDAVEKILHETDLVRDVICDLDARRLGTPSCTCRRWNAPTGGWEDRPSPFWNGCNTGTKGYDLLIFNFPHSDRAGRADKLVRVLFK